MSADIAFQLYFRTLSHLHECNSSIVAEEQKSSSWFNKRLENEYFPLDLQRPKTASFIFIQLYFTLISNSGQRILYIKFQFYKNQLKCTKIQYIQIISIGAFLSGILVPKWFYQTNIKIVGRMAALRNGSSSTSANWPAKQRSTFSEQLVSKTCFRSVNNEMK